MIEKAIAYKNSDNEFIASLKKLGLSDKEIESILKKYKRKKFEGGGDGGGDGGGGDGGGDGGDGSDGGDSGGDSGGEGDSTGDAGDDGGTAGPGDAGMGMGEADTMGSSTADDAASNQAASEAAAQAAADEATVGMQQNPAVETAPATGIMSQIGNFARQAFNAYTAFSPTAIAMNAINTAIGNISRGVTAPNDFSQATESVQSSAPATSTGGGGITTIQNYAPLTNVSTGNNTSDSIRTRLENLLKTQTVQVPTNQTVYQGQNINPLSNYTLLDLSNLRR